MIGNYQVRETGILGKVLLITDKRELVYYRRGNIYLYNTTKKEKKCVRLPAKIWKKLCCKIRLLERMLHMDARWAVQVGDDRILLQFDHKTLLIDIETSEINMEKNLVKGNPLSVAVIKGNPGFTDGIIVGDYTRNLAREEVNLYRRDDDGKWCRVYQFPAGTVRHIHGCISDPFRQCIYILTGDENEESGIWRAVNNFDRVEPLLLGSQKYRACQMLVGKNTLYYFTDAPSEQNYMYEIKNNVVQKLHAINGTCIYGVQFNKEGIYATTCEAEAHAANRFQYWFSNIPGRGICGRNVDVFVAGDDGQIQILKHFEHDGLPLRLFQYGTVTFTNVVENCCYFTSMCVKGKDMHIYKIIKKDGKLK